MKKEYFLVCTDFDACIDGVILGIIFQKPEIGSTLAYYFNIDDSSPYDTGYKVTSVKPANNQDYDYIVTVEDKLSDYEKRYALVTMKYNDD